MRTSPSPADTQFVHMVAGSTPHCFCLCLAFLRDVDVLNSRASVSASPVPRGASSARSTQTPAMHTCPPALCRALWVRGGWAHLEARDPSLSKWCSQSAPSQLPVSLAKAKPTSIPPQPSCCPTSAGQTAHPTSTSQTSPPSTNLLSCLRDSTRLCVSVKMLMSLEIQGITNHEQLTLRCLSSSQNQ